jgi:hypothetical protein
VRQNPAGAAAAAAAEVQYTCRAAAAEFSLSVRVGGVGVARVWIAVHGAEARELDPSDVEVFG